MDTVNHEFAESSNLEKGVLSGDTLLEAPTLAHLVRTLLTSFSDRMNSRDIFSMCSILRYYPAPILQTLPEVVIYRCSTWLTCHM